MREYEFEIVVEVRRRIVVRSEDYFSAHKHAHITALELCQNIKAIGDDLRPVPCRIDPLAPYWHDEADPLLALPK